MTKSTVTPEQKAERAAAWKACIDAAMEIDNAIVRHQMAQRRWDTACAGAAAEWREGTHFCIDGVLYLPDGTTREAE